VRKVAFRTAPAATATLSSMPPVDAIRAEPGDVNDEIVCEIRNRPLVEEAAELLRFGRNDL